MKRIGYFFIVLLTASIVFLGHTYGQIPSPGGVSGTLVWYKINPLGTDKQGDYSFEDCLDKQSRIKTIYLENDKLVEKDRWVESRSNIITSNFNPLFPIKGNHLATMISLGKRNLSSFTSFGVFYSKDKQFKTNGVLYQIDRGDQDALSIDKKNLRYYGKNKAVVSGKEYGQKIGANLNNLKAKLKANLGILCHSKASRPAKRTVWGLPLKETQILIAPNTKKLSDKNYSGKYIKEAIDKPTDIYCSEFLLYSRFLSAIERKCVESYLAIKYGLSLTSSYIVNPKKLQLLWDYDANKEYNHRITGFMVDSNLLINQTKALTRTEDFDNIQDYHDSFYKSDSYNEATDSTLLCIGRENANPLKEGYFLFGDNNKPLEFHKSKSYLGLEVLDRKWLASCKLDTITEQRDKKIWNVYEDSKGWAVKLKNNRYHFINRNNTRMDWYSQLQLKGDEGYYSFTYTGGALMVGFFRPSSMDYAYKINSDGIVSVFIGYREWHPVMVIQDNRPTDLKLKKGDFIEIIKTKDDMYIRVNNEYLQYSHIAINKGDQNFKFYGHIVLYNKTDVNVFCGGFINNGNKVELSLKGLKKENLKAENLCLIIDPSGKGDFNSENLVFIPATETDAIRQKVIFRNVFFDLDQNGKESFTFGYNEPPFNLYLRSKVNCNNQAGTVYIKASAPNPKVFYSYDLGVKGNDKQVLSGIFTDSTTISNISLGSYDLTVKAHQVKDLDVNHLSLRSENPKSFGLISWVCDKDTYAVTLFHSTYSQTRMNNPGKNSFGLITERTKFGRIYWQSVHNWEDIKEGDRISVLVNKTGAPSYWINGAKRESHGRFYYQLATENQSANFKGIFYLQGAKPIKGLYIDGFDTWTGENAQLAVNSNPIQTVTKDIILECDGFRGISSSEKSKNSDIDKENSFVDKNSHFLVLPTKDQHTYQAKLDIQSDYPAELIVFNSSGMLVKKLTMQKEGVQQTASFQLDQIGVYIVKALTLDKGEFTQKIIVE